MRRRQRLADVLCALGVVVVRIVRSQPANGLSAVAIKLVAVDLVAVDLVAVGLGLLGGGSRRGLHHL